MVTSMNILFTKVLMLCLFTYIVTDTMYHDSRNCNTNECQSVSHVFGDYLLPDHQCRYQRQDSTHFILTNYLNILVLVTRTILRPVSMYIDDSVLFQQTIFSHSMFTEWSLNSVCSAWTDLNQLLPWENPTGTFPKQYSRYTVEHIVAGITCE